jgi:hypothetical protein
MLERNDGWVRVARLEDGEWKSDQLAEGYFYGPPDLTVGDDGIVHAAYHDHGIEDAVYAVRAGGAWSLTAAADGGHDGWDNRITVDATGQPHMVGVDPSDFGGTDGVEYYGLTEDGTWVAEPVGSGPQTYRWAVSVAVDPDGTPWVAFHDGDALDLMLSHRTTDGWTVETIDAEGDTGLYNELRIGPDGSQHISYYQRLDPTSGIVRYAFREGPDADWQISDVDTLDNVFIGFTGARNITSIDLDSDLNPWIAYSDESVMRLARLVDGEWQIQTVTEAADVPLGQIVSLELDGDDRPHIAFADVTNKSELDGSVFYASLG